MKIIKSIEEAKKLRSYQLGFVPTMGALHEGHQALIQKSVQENPRTCVSIFVNPKQFNNTQDFETYPERHQEDFKICKDLGVEEIFIPSANQMYPEGESIELQENQITKQFEGAFRPGHFEGVLQVVLKLFGILNPDKSYFGQKDFQQYLLIKKMSDQFFLSTEVIGVETQRDDFGLALSSRNLNLSEDGLERARKVAAEFLKDQSQKEFLAAVQNLTDVEYYGTGWGRVLMAHYIEGVRLIDNKRNPS